MKGMTGTFSAGIVTLFTSWEIYAMVAAGLLGMFLVQLALNAAGLIAAQPGLTLADPAKPAALVPEAKPAAVAPEPKPAVVKTEPSVVASAPKPAPSPAKRAAA
jgi:hypothetical protein